MEIFLDEIEATLKSGIFTPALASALLIPDICGAAEGRFPKNGDRSRAWWDENMGVVERFPTKLSDLDIEIGKYFRFDGNIVWKLRNGMIHQSTLLLPQFGFERVVFTLPSASGSHHRLLIEDWDGSSCYVLDLERFCAEIVFAARSWLGANAENEAIRGRLDGLIQMRTNGFPPLIVGFPAIY